MPCHLQNCAGDVADDVDTNMDADMALFKKNMWPIYCWPICCFSGPISPLNYTIFISPNFSPLFRATFLAQ